MAGTKRQIQLTGVRKWFGNQLQQKQDNIYEHLENLLLRYGTGQLIIKQPEFDSDHNVTTVGYVLMNGDDGYRICEISGSYSGSGGDPFWMEQEFISVDQDVYTDSGTTKDISRKYIAADRSTEPSGPHLYVEDYVIYDKSLDKVLTLKELFLTREDADNHNQNNIDASFLGGDSLQDIYNNVETQEAWQNVTLDSGYSHITGEELRVRENTLGNVEILGKVIGDGSQGSSIGTMPTGYEPNEDQYFIAHLNNMVSEGDTNRIKIDTSGNITCISELSSNVSTAFNFTILR